MQYKKDQRVAYYEVTGKSEPCAAEVEIGGILIDRPQGTRAEWDFMNFETGEGSWLVGKRLGFARVNADLKPIPEPKLQAILEAKRAALVPEGGETK